MKTKSGFTIVEIMITVAIIAVLAAITVVAYTQVQTNTRNSTRKDNATILAQALEKYYATNGEYPSVRSLVNSYSDNTGSVVATKLGVDISVLLMPQMPSGTTNAFTSATPANDYIQYTASSASNNTACQTALTGGCDQFSLKYNEEGSANLITLNSRHNTGATSGTTPGAPAKPTVTVTLSGTNVLATATADPCSAGLTAKFSFHYRVNNGTWSAYSAWSTTATYSLPGTQGSTYDFQAATRCDNGTVAGQTSDQSDIASYTYPINPPSAPSVSVSSNGVTVTATIAAVSCPDGTYTQYATRNRTNDGTWSSYSDWSINVTASQSSSSGIKYGYQAKARCQSGAAASNEAEGAEGTTVSGIATPSAPVVSTSTTSGTTTWSYPGVSCPTGTTAEYQERDTTDWGYDSGWYGPTSATSSSWATGTYQGYQYIEAFQARCKTAYGTSNWSGTGQASYITPISTPGAPTGFSASLSSDRKTVTWNWTAPTCPTGLQNQDQKAGRYPSAAYGSFTAQGWYVPTWSQVLSNPPTVIPSGKQFQIEAKYVCVNATTGRQGSFGPLSQSSIYTAP